MFDLRTYRAKSLAEALRMVREELGPEASVLHTRRVGGGVWRWLAGGPVIEVTASNEVQAPEIPEEASQPVHCADLHDDCSTPWNQVDAISELEPPALVDRLGQQLSLQQMAPQRIVELLDHLRDTAQRDGLQHWGPLCQCLLQIVAVRLALKPPPRFLPARRRVIAMVGPTGVGKTTTLARLAALHRANGEQVGLITADTRRIAAIPQLEAYARMLDLPMEVVATAGELGGALDRLAEMDLVLVDTAGCSPLHDRQLEQLAELLRPAEPDETHLILSSTLSTSHQELAAESFTAAVGANSLTLTKLDESSTLGGQLSLLCDPHLPLGYVTSGQDVSDGIEQADRQQLAERIVGPVIAQAARTALAH